MAEQVTKPILLDETGQGMVEKLQDIVEAIQSSSPGGGIPEAPDDGNLYGRGGKQWKQAASAEDIEWGEF